MRKLKSYALALSTSNNELDDKVYQMPTRVLSTCNVLGFVLRTKDQAQEIVSIYGNDARAIFVDVEKKIRTRENEGFFNLERFILESRYSSKVIPFKPNDLTVSAALGTIRKMYSADIRGLGGKRACVFAAGNIGFKTALMLVESGVNVALFGRDHDRTRVLTEAINLTKPKSTLAHVHAIKSPSELDEVDFLVTCSSKIDSVSEGHLECMKGLKFVLDIGKRNIQVKGLEYLERNKILVMRLSVTDEMIRFYEGSIFLLKNGFEKIGRGEHSGTSVVSGGILGRRGDLIVDNYQDPREIFGICDGFGGFMDRQ